MIAELSYHDEKKMPEVTPRRVAVVGAGAAGMMAAIFSALSGAETMLIESTRDGGRKIIISGGGRCNILPMHLDESRFVTDSSVNSLRKILRLWPLHEQITFFNQLGLALAEETESGKLFPASNKARDVRDALLALAGRHGVRFIPNTTVTDIAPDGPLWRIECKGRRVIEADAVIVATGGLSIPLTGSDGRGLSIVAKLGHTINPTYPALTPILETPPSFAALAGISQEVTITAVGESGTAKATGGFLFTHQGYSGPAVLDVSHVAARSRSARLSVRWTPMDEGAWTTALTAEGGRTVIGVLRRELPARLADALVALAHVDPVTPLARLKREDRSRLVEALVRFDLPWTEDAGYQKAEVTGGGVSLAEIDPRTMQSRKHPGLFLCGEILDAFGPIGGYNFFWAWATGRAAGTGAAG